MSDSFSRAPALGRVCVVLCDLASPAPQGKACIWSEMETQCWGLQLFFHCRGKLLLGRSTSEETCLQEVPEKLKCGLDLRGSLVSRPDSSLLSANKLKFCRTQCHYHRLKCPLNYEAGKQLGKTESSQYFHNENLTFLVNDLFMAGMDTTTTTLRWAILLMMKYPEIQKKVRGEIDSIIGTAQPQAEHRKQMPYTDAVIHESQRFADIAPFGTPHEATQDVTFRGYFIPKGTIVVTCLCSALKDEAYFQKPFEFYPEHFLDEEGNFKQNDAFIPFSIGKRSCAGKTLAKIELFLFFTSIFQNFTFQAPPGAEIDLEPAVAAIRRPKSYQLCAIPRT